MTNYLNGSTRSGGSDVVVVPKSSGPPGIPEAPFDDENYLRQNGLWVPATAAIDSRIDARFNGLFDTRFNARRTWYRPQVYHSSIIGNTWETVPDVWTRKATVNWSVPGAGVLFIVQTADLVDRGTAAGDPEFRLQTISGPISSFSQSDGTIGTNSGGSTSTGSISTTAECDITGAGTVSLSAERRSSSSNRTDLEIRNWNIRGIFSPDVLGVS